MYEIALHAIKFIFFIHHTKWALSIKSHHPRTNRTLVKPNVHSKQESQHMQANTPHVRS